MLSDVSLRFQGERTGGPGHVDGVDVAAAGPELQDDATVAARRSVVQRRALRQVGRVRQGGAGEARQVRGDVHVPAVRGQMQRREALRRPRQRIAARRAQQLLHHLQDAKNASAQVAGSTELFGPVM